MKLAARRLALIAAMATVCLSACSNDDPVVAPTPAVSTVLDTQAKIDAFGAEGRTVYADRLVIGVENQPNRSITDLSPLSDLTFVGGLTIFYNEVLGDLTGLDNLVGLGGSLVITDNPKLTGIAPLAGVSAFGGDITVRMNDLLASLAGLDNLTTVEGDIRIEDNQSLTDMRAIGSVRTVSGDIVIRSNASIASIGTWTSLEAVEGDFIVHENPNLLEVAIAGLQTIGGDYSIRMNDLLASLAGLNDLTTVEGDIHIEDNQGLTDVDGFRSVRTVSGDIIIRSNVRMTSLGSWAGLEAVEGHFIVHENSQLRTLDIEDLQTIGGNYIIQANFNLAGINGAGVDVGGDVAIVGNALLVGIRGLDRIGKTLLIQRNSFLRGLGGLVDLRSVGGGLFLLDNPRLEFFCGLGPLMRAGFSNAYAAVGNQVNPTIEEIKATPLCP